jgi:hypothetical protein
MKVILSHNEVLDMIAEQLSIRLNGLGVLPDEYKCTIGNVSINRNLDGSWINYEYSADVTYKTKSNKTSAQLLLESVLSLPREQKINAIKFVRERTSAGLKEAKDYVEAAWEGDLYPERKLQSDWKLNP